MTHMGKKSGYRDIDTENSESLLKTKIKIKIKRQIEQQIT